MSQLYPETERPITSQGRVGSIVKVSWHHSCQYFLDISELEDWVEEKWPLVSSQDCGGDETAMVRLIKKH